MTKRSKKKNVPVNAAVAEEAKSQLVELDEENSSIVENEESSFINDDIEGPTDVGGFTILGDFKAKEKKIVERVLPNWLQHPVLISSEEVKNFASITDLDRNLVESLKANGIESCFPVQWTVIPELLAQCACGLYAGDGGFRPRDVCVSAPTGSGKTLTFVLPIIQALKNRVIPHVRALVILPVRDLAIQVYKVFKQYIQGTSLRVVLVAGKKDFFSEQGKLVRERPHAQPSEKWASMADIVVATKGRLLDHLDRTEGFDLTHLRFLVIDEADRQMDDVHDDWLSQVEKAAYTPKLGAFAPYHREKPGPLTIASCKTIVMHVQKLLFSATLSQNPEKLEKMNLFLPLLFASVAPSIKNPATPKANTNMDGEMKHDMMDTSDSNIKALSVDKFSTPALLKEKYMDCKAAEKPLILFHFLLNKKFQQVLCFTNSVESTHRLYLLAKQMDGLKVAELSSNIHTAKRERIIRKFVRGELQLLICSDVMTRGMDIENVQYVISYDAPSYIETYIHRVGRTARANKSGISITLLEGKEMFHFKKMLRESGRWDKLKRISVNRQHLEPLVPQFSKALKTLPAILKEQRRQQRSL
ncbi:ATP-dependent RNA helicase DDX51-like [Physella acuta]|uniref:ATP-dependent RNA helicase DDX51-like n=1 Tax=Physella acuta TaxID=109671 RepID=UPI0027DB6AF1|nr:ATP-dependent RNA helicase DDX51-like [Physella acuta]XP_059170671.1 ATP-dependent RNA helicase DDX51-like [Physella acuta]